MRTKSFLQYSLLMSAVAILALLLPASAQVSTVQLQEWLNLPTSTSHVGNITGNAKAAAPLYRRYCVGCHGDLGDGNGEVAQWLEPPMWPKPRNFQLGIFKCRSTPTGTLPTDEDLFDTIARGLDRSSMPIWNTFTKDERADLVAWIKHFSPRWQKEKAGNADPDSVRTGDHARSVLKRDKKFSEECNVGSATVCRAWQTVLPPRRLLTILGRRFGPTTSPTDLGPSAATPIATSTKSS